MSKCEACQDLSPVLGRPSRYEAAIAEDNIIDHVTYLFENNPTEADIDIPTLSWRFKWVDIESIDPEAREHPEQKNVALYERRKSVEKAKLTTGEGDPLVVSTDGKLIEGYARYHLLKDHFDVEKVPVYESGSQGRAVSHNFARA